MKRRGWEREGGSEGGGMEEWEEERGRGGRDRERGRERNPYIIEEDNKGNAMMK